MDDYSRHWFLCDERICLYNGASIPDRDPPRCIKHGAILDYAGRRYDGMTREQVRAEFKRQEQQETRGY